MSGLNLKLVTHPIVEPISVAIAKKQLRVDFSDDDMLIAGYIAAARGYCEMYTHRAFFDQTWLRTMDFFPLAWGEESINPAARGEYPFHFWDRLTIDLPRADLLSISSITYMDGTGTQQTLDPAAYNVDITSTPGRIAPSNGNIWPETPIFIPGSVRITFVAGSYIKTESMVVTAPSTAPITTALTVPTVTGVVSVVSASGTAVPFTLDDGSVTFTPPATAEYTINYHVGRCPQTVVMAILLLVAHFYEHREEVSELNLKSIPLGVNALLDTEKVTMFGYR